MPEWNAVKRRLIEYENRFVEDYLLEYSTDIAFAAYAFVFLYYGFLKVQAFFTGLTTPVRGEVGHLVTILGLPELGISITAAMVFIGVFEMGLGSLFALKRIRLALPVFLVHMAGTFVSLVIARGFYFKEPYIMGIPWLFDAFAAYILKNTIFVGAFFVLAAVELSDRKPAPATDATGTETSGAVPADD